MNKEIYTTLLIYLVGLTILIPGLAMIAEALNHEGFNLGYVWGTAYSIGGLFAIFHSGIFGKRKKKSWTDNQQNKNF